MAFSPVSDRVVSLDVLRGFALLGILVMNIQLFAMPTAAYINPYAFGDMQGNNYLVWFVSHLFADQKFMTLFSMLFGVGILVFSQRLEDKGVSSTALHLQRNFWLLVFGLTHGYLFWHGDILFTYALCGFVVYFFRNKAVTTLILSGLVMIGIASLLSLATGFSIPYMPAEAVVGMSKSWTPSDIQIETEIAAYTGGFASALSRRLGDTFFMQTYMFLNTFFWRAGGVMLLGMALFKSGFFTLRYSTKGYATGAIISLIIGLTLTLTGINNNQQYQFAMEYSMFIGNQFNYWGSLFVAFGYACLIMLMVKHKVFSGVQRRLAMIGKTAFSNYILHTVICSIIFYQLGYMGQFSRLEQFVTVIAICVFQILVTPLWLKHFRFGPLEWLWRTLTYRSFQPLRLEKVRL